MRLLRPAVAVIMLAGSLGLTAHASAADTAAAPARAHLRIDQAGYLPYQHKFGVLMAGRSLATAHVVVLDAHGKRVANATLRKRPAWSKTYRYVYGVDFSSLHKAGSYRLAVVGTSARSLPFAVTSRAALWSKVLRYGVRFDQVQRDGHFVVKGGLHRKPAHLHDTAASVYAWPNFEPDSDVITDADLTKIGGPVDVSDGWSDAGDYLKFTHSSAYADVLLYAAIRDLGKRASAALRAEALHGEHWLAKMWNAKTRTLYLQVGIGSGNDAGTFRGDHDGWRLPQADDSARGAANRYVAHRPVFLAAAPGKPISPNLVGRTAAAFALAAQVDATRAPKRAKQELAEATSLYAMADTASPPKPLVTALPNAFYPESSWHDDMELGAVEIARAARALHRPAARYVTAAAHWAKAYLATDSGSDTFNLYDVAALAHRDLLDTMGRAHLAVTRAQLVGDLRAQLAGAAAHSAKDPFAAGVDDTQFDVDSHTLGLVATAGWYRAVSGRTTYDALAEKLRGWVFGANAWGTSFMVGIGTVYPHCMQHQIANLSGGRNATAPLDLGAVVNGPNGADLFSDGIGGFQDGMVRCPGPGNLPAVTSGRFDGSGSVYLDDVRSWQTDEPALDMTGAAIIAAASQLSS